MPSKKKTDCEYGILRKVGPGIRRLLAPNPGPFTLYGTGTFVIGKGNVAVIDPGPAIPAHIEALVRGLRNETITHILITHTHLDHSPGCAGLKDFCDAPTYGFGPHGSGREHRKDRVRAKIAGSQEEGADFDFTPDIEVRDGDIITGGDFVIQCLHTPGHTSNHVCYRLCEGAEEGAEDGGTLFCGDHVMGWSTTIVSPPDGDMGAYIASLERLLEEDDRIYWPTHGDPIRDPKARIETLIHHRQRREREIVDCLHRGIDTIPEMVRDIYRELPVAMHRAAERSVLASIIHLIEQGMVSAPDPVSLDSRYTLAAKDSITEASPSRK
ncbi:MBL fold metallo-hydrolase [Thioalkalivibrio sp. HK1]|uniref:MBL fold metallo-hydrolase n=1 Tax=Thioalkalivibrio sp. HK1 TaxID=1469245 RepID=UPI00047294E3|nr:MBL fold metallo-hydrolase [Thioalkalivibrio sp. HK1]